MSNRRRRAHDFTDSLTKFRQTISDEKSNPVFQASSENRLNYMRDKPDEDDKPSCSKNDEFHNSVILAGSLASQQCISNSLSNLCNTVKKSCNIANNNSQLSKNMWNISDETSYLSLKPDLNKCINLFDNEHLNEGYDNLVEQLNTTLSETTSSENVNIRHLNKNTMGQQNINNKRSHSAESLKNIISLNEELQGRSKSYTTLDRILKRDANYNIKADQLRSSSKNSMKISHSEKDETLISSFNSLSLPKSSALPRRKEDSNSKEDNQQHDSVSSEKSSKEELDSSELRIFLSLLADQKPLKEPAIQQRLLRRLSANCYDSPKVFTEGLLTIIEESVMNNDSLQYPEVSLRRFSKEVRKMCKFIEDETVPEWPQSPGKSTPTCAKRKSQERESNILWEFVGTLDKDTCTVTISPRCNIKSPKKVRRISKNTMKNLHDSTNTFENWEAYCETLYPNEYKTHLAKEKIQSESPLRNMNNIRRACESQMASLEDSFNIQEEIKKAETRISDSADQHNKMPEMQNLQRKLVSREKYDGTNLKKVSDTFKQRTGRSKRHERIELDDLESTIMYEIAKKRQRCLDTAKVMMEIDANLESMKTMEIMEKAYPKIVIKESSPTTNDDKFMEILMCVKKYQDYLEAHKPLINLLHRVRSNGSRNRKDARAKKNENFDTCTPSGLLGDKSTLRTPKLSSRKKNKSPLGEKRSTNKTVVSKPLFITPGKKYFGDNRRAKRTYFPNLLPKLDKQDESINPHAKKVYRELGIYDHVKSPVGMYIKGRNLEGTNLKINLRPKRDEITPKRKQTIRSPSPKPRSPLSLERPKEKETGTTNKLCSTQGCPKSA